MPRVAVPEQPTLAERMVEAAKHLEDPTGRGVKHYGDVMQAITLLRQGAQRLQSEARPLTAELGELQRATTIMRNLVEGRGWLVNADDDDLDDGLDDR